MNDPAKSILLITNSKAGSSDDATLEKCRQILTPTGEMTFEAFLQNHESLIASGQYKCFAVAGGDGSIEAVASKLIGHEKCGLGVIPVGTFNNFARSLDLPLDAPAAAERVVTGKPHPVDVAWANDRPFFECLGVGMDAALFPVAEEIKSGGGLTRWLEFFKLASKYEPKNFVLTLDRPAREAICTNAPNRSRRLSHRLGCDAQSKLTFSAIMLSVSNGPYFGMNFTVAPHEKMDDGKVTITIYHRYSKLQLWWHFYSIAFGKREYRPKSTAFQVEEALIEGSEPVHAHLDGTPQEGLWPIKVRCGKGALQVYR